MARRGRLGRAWAVLALALALASCVSPEELRREDEATCAGFGLIVSRRKAWRGVIGLRRLPRIGVGVPGGAEAGGRTGLDRTGWAGGRGPSPRSPRDGHPSTLASASQTSAVQNECLSG